MCELPEFCYETYPVARKPHECCECRQEIRVGQRYVRIAGKWDGSLYTEKMHSVCREFFTKVVRLSGYDCIEFGGLGEEVRDSRDPALFDEWERVKAAAVA